MNAYAPLSNGNRFACHIMCRLNIANNRLQTISAITEAHREALNGQQIKRESTKISILKIYVGNASMTQIPPSISFSAEVIVFASHEGNKKKWMNMGAVQHLSAYLKEYASGQSRILVSDLSLMKRRILDCPLVNKLLHI